MLCNQSKRKRKDDTASEVVKPPLKKSSSVQLVSNETFHSPITLPFDGYNECKIFAHI